MYLLYHVVCMCLLYHVPLIPCGMQVLYSHHILCLGERHAKDNRVQTSIINITIHNWYGS